MIHELDAVAWLSTLEACSVHAIVTDPPYCSGDWQESKQMARVSAGQNEGERSQWFASDSMSTAGLVWLLRAVAHEAHRVLVPGGHMFVCCAWRQEFNVGPAIESTGVRMINRLIWDKGTPGQGEHFRSQYETILHFAKGVARKGERSGQWGNVLDIARVHHTARIHPTEKPLELADRLILVSTFPGERVVDPFTGAGWAGVSARRLGRDFAGAERDPIYAAHARARILDEPVRAELSHGQTGFDYGASDGTCTPIESNAPA